MFFPQDNYLWLKKDYREHHFGNLLLLNAQTYYVIRVTKIQLFSYYQKSITHENILVKHYKG